MAQEGPREARGAGERGSQGSDGDREHAGEERQAAQGERKKEEELIVLRCDSEREARGAGKEEAVYSP